MSDRQTGESLRQGADRWFLASKVLIVSSILLFMAGAGWIGRVGVENVPEYVLQNPILASFTYPPVAAIMLSSILGVLAFTAYVRSTVSHSFERRVLLEGIDEEE